MKNQLIKSQSVKKQFKERPRLIKVLWTQLLATVFVGLTTPIFAGISVYNFDNDAQEKRFQHLTSILRCLQCQNQTLADTNSNLGDDLKDIIYEKIIAGENDEAIVLFMKERYGEFILYEPELSQSNLLLWLGPILFLLVLLGSGFLWYQKNKDKMFDD
jgi:cytochrome c-type biogenesis protein CcmH